MEKKLSEVFACLRLCLFHPSFVCLLLCLPSLSCPFARCVPLFRPKPSLSPFLSPSSLAALPPPFLSRALLLPVSDLLPSCFPLCPLCLSAPIHPTISVPPMPRCASFVQPVKACRRAMDIGNVGQYVQLLEGIQQLWHNPQLQQLYHLHATQRNHNTRQLGPCPIDSQPPLPPPFNHPFLTHPSPPPTFAFEHPSTPTSPHKQHPEQHSSQSPPRGHHNQPQSWQWPCLLQPTAHNIPHIPHTPPATPAWTFPPVVPHPQGDPQYPPPSNFSHDPGQHSSSPSRHNAPDRETPGPEREPSTHTFATRHSITPESLGERTRQHLTFRSPTEDIHSLHSEAEQHPLIKADDPDEKDASSHSGNHCDSSSCHKKKWRGKHKRSRDDLPRREHKRRRKHSSSSYSSCHQRQHTQHEHPRAQHHGSHKQVHIRRRRRNTHALAVQKEERWLTLSHKSWKKTTPPPVEDCFATASEQS